MKAPVPTADGATPLALLLAPTPTLLATPPYLAGATTVDFLLSAASFFGDSLPLAVALLKSVVVGRLVAKFCC